MPPEPPDPPLVLLDACCVINLLASGVIEEVFDAVPASFAVARLVAEDEVLFVAEEDDAQPDDAQPEGDEAAAGSGESARLDRERLDLMPLTERGRLEVMELGTREEHETFVELALQLDDGEAMTAALAIHRGGEVATDERKAIRLLEGRSPPVPLRRTSALLRMWVRRRRVPEERVREVLRRIQRRASFTPPRDDPEVEWWRGVVRLVE